MENQYLCSECNYETTRKLNYERHLNSKKHLKNISPVSEQPIKKRVSKKKYFCNYCEKYIRDSTELNRHLASDKHLHNNAIRTEAAIANLGQFPKADQKKATRQTIKRNAINKFEKSIEYSSKTQSKTDSDSEEPKKIVEKKVKNVKNIIFKKDEFKEYSYLDNDEMKELINIFVKYIKSQNKNIEEFINYEDYDADDANEIIDTYNEIYEQLIDDELYDSIIN